MGSQSKEKYTQEIPKLMPSSVRLKEQITGRILGCWKETLHNGRTKILAIVSDGDKMNNVLTAEAWNDADQAYAVRVIMPLIGQVASFEKAKVGNKGKTTVFHTKRIKMCFDKNTDVKKRPDDKKFPHALPLLDFQDIPNMHTMCTISVQACVQEAAVPVPRPVDGGQKMVTNLKVALGDKEIEAAFWGDELAKEMGQAQPGDVYRFDWITLVPHGQDLFKLASNGGTFVKKITGAEADLTRASVAADIVSLSPQFRQTRQQKLARPTCRVSLSFVSHMQDADISDDNSNAYQNTVIVPCCYVKEIRTLSAESDLPFYWGCPQCRKMLESGLCPEHGVVGSPIKIEAVIIVLQDPMAMWEGVLWTEPLCAFKTAIGIPPEVPDEDVFVHVAEKAACCEFVARITVGTNKEKNAQTVDFFDLAPALTDEVAIASFPYLPYTLSHAGEGLAPVCCKHLSVDNVGQLLANDACGKVQKHIDSALGLFRIDSEPDLAIVPDVDGMIVKITGKCVVCDCVCTLQQAGAPQTVQKLIRTNVGDVVLAFIGLQSDGNQPFEVQQMRSLSANASQFEKLFKFQVNEYQKWISDSKQIVDEKRPCADIQDLLNAPVERKRLRLQKTSDGKDL